MHRACRFETRATSLCATSGGELGFGRCASNTVHSELEFVENSRQAQYRRGTQRALAPCN
jgi:hypothetical protein